MTLEDYSEEWVRRQEAISERSRCFVCLAQAEDPLPMWYEGAYVLVCPKSSCVFAINVRNQLRGKAYTPDAMQYPSLQEVAK